MNLFNKLKKSNLSWILELKLLFPTIKEFFNSGGGETIYYESVLPSGNPYACIADAIVRFGPEKILNRTIYSGEIAMSILGYKLPGNPEVLYIVTNETNSTPTRQLTTIESMTGGNIFVDKDKAKELVSNYLNKVTKIDIRTE